jgi:hypothetical protein
MGDTGREGTGEGIDGAIKRRSQAEATYLGVDAKTYRNLPDRKKVKYAAIRKLKGSESGAINSKLRSYGEDLWVFRKDRVKNRATFVLGDSLNRLIFNESVRSAYAADFSGFRRLHWDEYFIPLKYLLVAVPEALPHFKAYGEISVATMSVEKRLEWFRASGYADLTPYQRSAYEHPLANGQRVHQNGATYLEVQIFDDLTLDDVEAFEFTKNPPTPKFCTQLKARGIKIIDRRGGSPVPFD